MTRDVIVSLALCVLLCYCAGALEPVHILVVFRTTTGAMGLRMRRVNRLDRACVVFYRQLSDISVAVCKLKL